MLGPASSMPSKPSLDPVLKDWSIENIHMRGFRWTEPAQST